MMNEFPDAFKQATYKIQAEGGVKAEVVALNGTEYLELIEAAGCHPEDYPPCQAIGQHLIWERVDLNNCTPEAVEKAIQDAKKEHHNFHVDGASWTNHISWVKGYENVLEPMNQLSAKFHQKFDPLLAENSAITRQADYRQALLYNLLLQTSCFRYWGQGVWTDYAREIYRRGEALM